MNRLHHSLLVPLIAVLGVLLGLVESASAAFNHAAAEVHYEENLLWESEGSGQIPLQPADPTRGNGEWIYDGALGVPVYVRQNPWTSFDPEGLSAWSDFKGYWKGVGNAAGGMAKGLGVKAWNSNPAVNLGQVLTGNKTGYQKEFESGISAFKGYVNPAENLGATAQQNERSIAGSVLDVAANHVDQAVQDPEKFGELSFHVVLTAATTADAAISMTARGTVAAAETEVAAAKSGGAGTETVQRWMSRAELEATGSSGLLRGG